MSVRSFTLKTDQPIGLFDSGLGGLTVFRELKRLLPSERLIYLGDTARTPYGSKSASTIIRYAHECAKFLSRHEIKLLVVACNTASSLALDALTEACPFPVIGTVTPAVQAALAASSARRIGVIGTEATIASRVYENQLHALDPTLSIFSKACPLFVPLVEQGMCSGEITDKVIEYYLADMKQQHVDTLILGCTHYPLLVAGIRRFFGPDVHIVECGAAIANVVSALLLREKANVLENSRAIGPQYSFYVTDEVSRFNQLTRLCLNTDDVEAKKVELVDEA